MIATVTLNTSLDKLYLVDSAEPYRVHRVKKCVCTAGGKGINVAKAAKKLGEQVSAVGLTGGGGGLFIRSALRELGIRDRLTDTGKECRSCINIREEATGRHTEYLEPGPEIAPEQMDSFWKDFRSAVEESEVITISGSAPAGVSPQVYGEMVRYARQKDRFVLLDASGPLLESGMEAAPSMVKPNLDELAQLLGHRPSPEELPEAAARLNRMGIGIAAVSLGEDGVLVSWEGRRYRGIPPRIDPVNTVGCGDCMVAGFAAAIRRGMQAEEAIRLAVAVSAANALTPATGDFRMEDLEKLYGRVMVERL